jgi:hypothetical protein
MKLGTNCMQISLIKNNNNSFNLNNLQRKYSMTTLTLNENGFACGHRARQWQATNQDHTGLLAFSRQVLEAEGRELHAKGKEIWNTGKALLDSILRENQETISAIYRDADDERFLEVATGELVKEDLTTKPFVFPSSLDEVTPELLALREQIFATK